MRRKAQGWVERRPLLAAALAYGVIATAGTWPLARGLFTAIAGHGDPWQYLWSFWLWRESLAAGRSPFFTDLLHWPTGLPMWFQVFDIPSATLALPFWGLVPDVTLYNAAIWLTLPASGLAFYALSRELWGGRLAPFLAGCLYTFSAFHMSRVAAHLHVSAIQWSPLYFLGLVRMLRGGGAKDAALAGAALGLATLASPYHVFFCFVATAALFSAWALEPERRRELLAPRFWRLAAAMLGVYAVVAGWYLAGMARAGAAEPYAVPHQTDLYSADLLNFFVPNPGMALGTFFRDVSDRWSTRGMESSAYAGYVPLALAILGALRVRAARPYLWTALVGAVLALGPSLRVGGRLVAGASLPFAWLERLIPPLSLSGCPNKLAWCVSFGLAAAAGASLARLCAGTGRQRLAACAWTLFALLEAWPRPMELERYAQSAFLRELAARPETFAVLDASEPLKALWNGMQHRRPQPGGYVGRAPIRLERAVLEDPLLKAFLGPWPSGLRADVAFEREDARLELDGEEPGREGWIQAQWTGGLRVKQPGTHRFWLRAQGYSGLWIDGRPAAGGPGPGEYSADVTLQAGEHPVRVLYRRDGGGPPRLRAAWRRPDGAVEPLGGLRGSYLKMLPDLGLPREAALRRLAELQIRYVLTDGSRRGLVALLGLPRVHAEEGLEVYRVPPLPVRGRGRG